MHARNVPGFDLIYRAFLTLGGVTVVAGLGVALYSIAVVRPHVATLNDTLVRGFGGLDRTLRSLDEDAPLRGASRAALVASDQLLSAVPATLQRTRALLLKTAETGVRTSRVIRETERGVTGLVAPKEELAQSRASLRGTSQQLRELADELATMESATAVLVGSVDGAQRALAARGGTGALLANARTTVANVHGALTGLNLPRQLWLLGLGLGGGLILLGACLIVTGVGLDRFVASVYASRAVPMPRPQAA
jgi:hypothetical protein